MPVQFVKRLALLLLLIGSASASAQSSDAPLCVYESKTYSDGAAICAQKSMMLTCQTEGTKATWKFVADKEMNERCTAPISRVNASESRPRMRRSFVRAQVAPVGDPNARCFNFNGKRYCE